MTASLKSGLALGCAALLAGCTTLGEDGRTLFPETRSKAFYPDKTQTQFLLAKIPAPTRPIAVAVYGFADQTGQFKPVENGQTLSRAVSQGGGAMLVKALQDAGNRQWFTIVERESLKNLLNERQIIREMRERYLGEEGSIPKPFRRCCSPACCSKAGSSGTIPIPSPAVRGRRSSASAASRNTDRTPSRSTCARSRSARERC